MRLWRLAIVVAAPLLVCPPDRAAGQPAPTSADQPETVLRLGALLPLTGPGTWFGNEIKRGLELAGAELKPPTSTQPGSTGPEAASAGTLSTGEPSTGTASPVNPSSVPGWLTAPLTPSPPSGGRSPSETAHASPPRDEVDEGGESAPRADSGGDSIAPGAPKAKAPPVEPVEPLDRPRTVTLAVQVLDVQPLDLREAGAEMNRLLASGVTAVVTASPTPTLTALPLATARDVLLLHAGLPSDRFPPTSRTLLQLRPLVSQRAEILAAHAWELGVRRLALLAGGDDFGRAVRAGTAARWRKKGGSLVREESLSLDAADLRSRFRVVARSGAEAVVLGYQGAALGEAALALRGVGYAGRLLAADDDRAALLAAGPALDGMLIVSDAFVPVPGTRGARFARAYETRHSQPPSRFAASAYEAAVLLADAAPRATRGGSLSGSRLRDALVAGRRYPSLYAGEVTVRDDGTFGRPLAVFRAEGGKLTFDGYVDLEGRALSAEPQGSEAPSPRLGFLAR